MVTASTLPVLILVALLWRMTKGQILPIVIFTSAFSAASAFNLGALGVQPWLFSFILCVLLKLALGAHPVRLAPRANRTAVLLLLLFVIYAVASAVISPYLFHGATVVRSGIITQLTWSTSNLAQSFYLLVAASLYLLTLSKPLEELESAVQWYIRASITASCIAMYQLANAVLHVPFPSPVLYSNPTYVIYNAYQINGMWRLNGPFCEASEMASFLIVGIALLGWELLTKPARLYRVAAFILMIISLLMTLSSLGYASLIIMGILAVSFYGYSVIRRGISPVRFVVAIVLVGAIAILCTLSTKAVGTVDKVITSTLIDKSTSDSYKERTETHAFALQTLEQTDYVGAGWGSLRASGFAYILLGTLGIPGTMLFLCFYLSLFQPLLRRSFVSYGGLMGAGDLARRSDLYAKAMFAATMLLCAMLIAGSEPVTPILWVLFGVATVAQSAKFVVSTHSQVDRLDNLVLERLPARPFVSPVRPQTQESRSLV